LRETKAFPPDQASALAASAGGSIGRALAMAREDDIRVLDAILNALTGTLTGREDPTCPNLVEVLGKEREEVVRRLEMVRICLRDLLVWKETGSRDLLLFGDRLDLLGPLSEKISGRAILSRIESLESTRRAVEQNANRPLALEAMLLNWSRAS